MRVCVCVYEITHILCFCSQWNEEVHFNLSHRLCSFIKHCLYFTCFVFSTKMKYYYKNEILWLWLRLLICCKCLCPWSSCRHMLDMKRCCWAVRGQLTANRKRQSRWRGQIESAEMRPLALSEDKILTRPIRLDLLVPSRKKWNTISVEMKGQIWRQNLLWDQQRSKGPLCPFS